MAAAGAGRDDPGVLIGEHYRLPCTPGTWPGLRRPRAAPPWVAVIGSGFIGVLCLLALADGAGSVEDTNLSHAAAVHGPAPGRGVCRR